MRKHCEKTIIPKINAADIITVSRIVLSAVLVFLRAFSPAFYLIYILAGISDGADGIVARHICGETKHGEILDSVADGIFFTVSIFKVLSAVSVPSFILVWCAVIAAFKLICTAVTYKRKKQLILHTVLNKITGAALFLLPLSLAIIDICYSSSAVLVTASVTVADDIRRGYKNERRKNNNRNGENVSRRNGDGGCDITVT